MNVPAIGEPAKYRADHLNIEVLRGRSAFLSMKSEWDELFEREASPHHVFQGHGLLAAWADSYRIDGEIILLTCRIDGKLAGVLPLTRRSTLGFVRLQGIGLPIAQYSDALAAEFLSNEISEALLTAALGLKADFLEIRRIREDGNLWPVGHDYMVSERLVAPFADLARRVEGCGPGRAYSARYRSGYRRKVRLAQERGHLAMYDVEASRKAVALAAVAIAYKRGSLRRLPLVKRSVETGMFRDFFMSAASEPACGLQVSVVQIGAEPAGVDLSFRCKGRVFGHVLATDPSYRKEGIGSLLVHFAFENALASGASTFDLLAPADSYKMQHADGSVAVESRIWPMTRRGRMVAHLLHGKFIPFLKSLG